MYVKVNFFEVYKFMYIRNKLSTNFFGKNK